MKTIDKPTASPTFEVFFPSPIAMGWSRFYTMLGEWICVHSFSQTWWNWDSCSLSVWLQSKRKRRFVWAKPEPYTDQPAGIFGI